MNILNGNYLFQTPAQSPSGVFTALTVGFGLLLVLGAIVYWRRNKVARNNPVLRVFIRRVSQAAMYYSVVGLFLAAMRYLSVDYLAMPIWMYLLLLCMIVSVSYYVYQFMVHVPVALWKIQQNQVERRYRPTARPRTEPQRPRPKVRGKQRR